ncbi:MAG TPA: heavy metal translocating P-type ATPase [Chloroflexaceae bacterium]|mgnify:CR=1 FL=1|nr:heavy metal translocating P-type ATPase [Chloroflexaceae bacterium]
MTHQHHAAAPATTTLSLAGLHCTGCADAVERTLKANPHITSVHIDWPNNVAHVGYHAGMIDEAAIRALIEATGCPCERTDHAGRTDGQHEPAAHGSAQARLHNLRHGVDVQPITMGTRHDRMQYELPATSAHAQHATNAAAARSHDHAAMGHGAHGGAAPTPAAPMDHGAMGHGGMDHGAMGHDMSDPSMAAAMERDMRNKFFIALVLTIPTVLYSPMGMNIFGLSLPTFGLSMDLIMLILTTPVVFYCGWMFIGGAYQSLRRRALNMSVLVATGVLAAYGGSLILMALGQETFFEAAAMLVTFVLFGHWMEMRSRRGTSDALRALFDLVPPQATVLRDGQELTIPSSEVLVGDTVILKPGDKVPVDGEVIDGETSIDEALVTGESVPVTKRPGDGVIAGSINRSGSVRFRATKVGADTTLAQIVDLVQRAQNSKAPGQRLADQAAQYLVILAVGAGLLTFIVWYFVVGAPIALALTFAISAMVIACPDALGLATPTAVAVGTGVAARHNILIKDAATLEGVSAVTAIVLDKTGTLTEGKPALTDVVTRGSVAEQELLRLVASAERGSEHPLAEAIVAGARERGLQLAEASQFDSIAGHGIAATVDGRRLLIGNAKLMRDQGVDAAALEARAAELASGGKTPMFVAVDGQAAGLVAVADTIKPTAAETIRRLVEQGIEPVMITGDNKRTAEAVAKQLGIARFFAEVLPADKANHVKALQGEGKKVAMVGDGVNDAPALAQADIGIAIGAGTDVAIETANVVLMKSDPLDILRAITLSKATVRKMKQNLFWAAIYNVLAIPVAAGVLYPSFGIELRPEWAALLMSASSIIVAVNAVLLRNVERELGGPSQPQPATSGRTAPAT